LAKTLCPHLGSKGSIAHDEVQVSSLQENRAQLLDYMELDISLLGGVLLFYFPRHSSNTLSAIVRVTSLLYPSFLYWLCLA
jgi:hypothetical protein